MRGRKPFRIPQIPKRRTLSPATGHDRDKHRSRSRSRTSQRRKLHEEVNLVKAQNTVQVIVVGNQEEVAHPKDVAQEEEAHPKEEEEALLKE